MIGRSFGNSFFHSHLKTALLINFFKGLEDSMRRNAVRSIAGETTLFGQKELEQLYAAFKVTVSVFERN